MFGLVRAVVALGAFIGRHFAFLSMIGTSLFTLFAMMRNELTSFFKWLAEKVANNPFFSKVAFLSTVFVSVWNIFVFGLRHAVSSFSSAASVVGDVTTSFGSVVGQSGDIVSYQPANFTGSIVGMCNYVFPLDTVLSLFSIYVSLLFAIFLFCLVRHIVVTALSAYGLLKP